MPTGGPFPPPPSFEHGGASRRINHRRKKPKRWAGRRSTGARHGGLGGLALTAVLVGWMVLTVTGSGSNDGWHGTSRWLGADVDRPPLAAAVSEHPLGLAPPPPSNAGPFEFLNTQPTSDQPVAYDPCRPIHIVVNNLHAPAGSTQLVRSALEQVTEATGLQFVVEGVTTEIPDHPRAPYQPDRYGERWAPVILAWMSEAEISRLSEAAGLGGSVIAPVPGSSSWVYVSGVVILDGPLFDRILASSRGWFQAETIIMHEFGHLLGLDHVDDPRQVMGTHRDIDVLRFGSGDLAGLSALGSGRCFDRV